MSNPGRPTPPHSSTSEREVWGELDGEPVERFTLRSTDGSILRVSSFGATITELHLPDRDGRLADVVLGFDDLDGYLGGHPYFGGVVGRCANRIAGGAFELDGTRYQLACNGGAHHLHGGGRGFDRRVWTGESQGPGAVEFTRTSPDGEEGYPGEVQARVRYELNAGSLMVSMSATCDAPTLLNLAQHTYWNLAGHDSGSVAGHALAVNAGRYVPVGEDLIPRGELLSVEGTPFDLRSSRPLGGRLSQSLAGPLQPPGYDHDFVIDGEPHALRPVAELTDPGSGRTLALDSDQPGCQLYTGNGLEGSLRGKGGAAYVRHGGLCLETQAHPDAIHQPGWPQPVLRPGERSLHRMRFRFGVDGSGDGP
jgi:aldose 1-epimerase